MTDGPPANDRARSIFDQLRSARTAKSDVATDPPVATDPAAVTEVTGITEAAGVTEADAVSDSTVATESPATDESPVSTDPPQRRAPARVGVGSSAAQSHDRLTPRIALPPDLDEALNATLNSPDSGTAGPGSGAPTGSHGEMSEPPAPNDEYGRPRHPGAVSHDLPRCLAVANQKGGVGKTTTTVNLGASLAELGYRVLVIDLDPQGNATTGLGINGRNLDASVYNVILHDVPMEDVIEPTTLRNLFVVPATIDLAGAEIELVPVFSRELRLRRALESIEADFDFVLVDCPPSLGLLTVNALAAAGEVLVPIQCEYYALEGLSQLLRNVNLVKTNLNHQLEVSTIVLTMYDARTKLAEQVADEVREHFGSRVCRNVVPRTVRLSEAPSFGQPVTTFDPSSRGAIAYRELAKEVSGGAPQRVR
jgi:chromosome partitioning protein